MAWRKRPLALKIRDQGRFSILKDDESFSVLYEVESGEASPRLVCLGLDDQGYYVNGYIVREGGASPDNAVTSFSKSSREGLQVVASRLQSPVRRLLIVLTTDEGCSLDEWGKGYVQVCTTLQEWQWGFHGASLGNVFTLKMLLFRCEGNGVWNFNVEGQGFSGDIQKLMRLLERPEEEIIAPAAAPAPLESISDAAPLEMHAKLKRIQLMASHFLDNYQVAQILLDTLDPSVMIPAHFVLVVDHTDDMEALYKNGQIQTLVEQLISLSAHWNLCGDIEIFLAARQTTSIGTVHWNNYVNAVSKWETACPFDVRVQFGRAIETVRKAVYPTNNGGETKELCKHEQPVFVLWIMSHDVDDVSVAQWQLRWASREPIFWMFMALTQQVGRLKSSNVLRRQGGVGGDFRFIDQLDELSGCALHNTDYFTVSTLGGLVPNELYKVLLEAYSAWLTGAIRQGMVLRSL